MMLKIKEKTLQFVQKNGVLYEDSNRKILNLVLQYIPKQELRQALSEMEKKNHTSAKFGIMRGEFLYTTAE